LSFRLCIEESLAQDPRNKFDRGKVEGEKKRSNDPWSITVDGLECFFIVREKEVFVSTANIV
jgi:hypothetical protein